MSRVLPISLMLLACLMVINLVPVWANTDSTGGTGGTAYRGNGNVYAFPITITASGTVQSIGVNWPVVPAGNVRVALYSAGSGVPASLLVDSGTVPVSTSAGWQDISVASYSITAGNYWVAIQISNGQTIYFNSAARSYYGKTFGPFDATWNSNPGRDNVDQWNMRVTYTTGPPPPPPSDFTISTTTNSQTISAGATATYLLDIQYSSTLTATVNLAVTSGCPPGITCTVSPNPVTGSQSVTLSVPTQLITSGSFSITVTASSTSPVLSHTVTVQLTVNGPATFPITVHAGATQVIITVSWTGSGTAPVTLAGPNNSPVISESAAVVYDRTSIPSGSSTPTYIHRITFTLSPSPSSAQTWTAYVSITVTGGYSITTEVS